MITGFFVFVFGTLWFCSTKYYVKPNTFRVLAFDKNGIYINQNEIRVCFSTLEAAFSYANDYQKLYPEQKFCVETLVPKFKRRLFMFAKF